jgi:hypothetical protein
MTLDFRGTILEAFATIHVECAMTNVASEMTFVACVKILACATSNSIINHNNTVSNSHLTSTVSNSHLTSSTINHNSSIHLVTDGIIHTRCLGRTPCLLQTRCPRRIMETQDTIIMTWMIRVQLWTVAGLEETAAVVETATGMKDSNLIQAIEAHQIMPIATAALLLASVRAAA